MNLADFDTIYIDASGSMSLMTDDNKRTKWQVAYDAAKATGKKVLAFCTHVYVPKDRSHFEMGGTDLTRLALDSRSRGQCAVITDKPTSHQIDSLRMTYGPEWGNNLTFFWVEDLATSTEPNEPEGNATVSLNKFQKDVLAYLSNGGTRSMRADALQDLIERGVFGLGWTEEHVKTMVEGYIKANVRGFCKEGIERFRQAVNLPAPQPNRIRIVLDIEVEDKTWDGTVNGDRCFSSNLRAHLKGAEIPTGGGTQKIVSVQWVDYTTQPDNFGVKSSIVRK